MHRPTVLLFDVDGTLLTTGGVGKRAIEKSLAAAGSPATTNFSFAGMTDRAIIRQALLTVRQATDPGTVPDAAIDAVLSAYKKILPREIAAAEADSYCVHPGLPALLEHVYQRPGVACGLGTGNIEFGARAKLERVGFNHYFAFGGFGCDSELRPELIRAGAEKGATCLQQALSSCRVVVIGDTPKDIAAAKAIGAESVAVATGRFGLDALQEHQPTVAFENLAGEAALKAILGSG